MKKVFPSSYQIFCAGLTIVLMSFFYSASAQDDPTNPVIDSLIVLLMNDSESPEKVDVYSKLSNEYLPIDYTIALTYSIKGLELADRIEYSEGILTSQLAIAYIYQVFMVDYFLAKKYYDKSLPLAESLNDSEAQLKIYRGLSYISGVGEDYEMAKKYNSKAMDIALTMDNYSLISELNAYMGGLYEESGDTLEAIDYYGEVLEIERKNDFRETSNASMIAVARYYFLKEDTKQALKYYRIALKSFERLDDHRWVSYTHSEMAKLYLSSGDFKRAEMHGEKGLEIAKTNTLRKELGDNYLVLSEIYKEMDSIQKSEEYMFSYDSLQSTLEEVELSSASIEENETISEPTTSSTEMNRFLQAIILCLPALLAIILLGLPSKKKA